MGPSVCDGEDRSVALPTLQGTVGGQSHAGSYCHAVKYPDFSFPQFIQRFLLKLLLFTFPMFLHFSRLFDTLNSEYLVSVNP